MLSFWLAWSKQRHFLSQQTALSRVRREAVAAMKQVPGFGLLMVLLVWPWAPAHARTLDLYTFHAPPYQVEPDPASRDPEALGTTTETVRCIVEGMDWQSQIRAVPQSRAIHGLRNGLIDGYFAVDESDLLNEFALSSAPVALEKWYFYSTRPIEDMDNVRIAAIADSNEAMWLDQSPYTVTMTVSYPEQLLALLYRGRVDAIVMDERVMALQRAQGHNPDDLHRSFIRFAPLRLYLAHRFVSRHPLFLAAFNQQIEGCVTEGYSLNQRELDELADTARALMDDLLQQVGVTAALARLGAPTPLGKILEVDRKWRALAPAEASEIAVAMLASQLSREMASWQRQQNGMVNEALVMDTIGANVAISVLTSDYWQGDEHKFEAIAGKPVGAFYLGPLRFDNSAQLFQVFVSRPVHDPASGRFLGGVAFGLDIEQALKSPYQAEASLP